MTEQPENWGYLTWDYGLRRNDQIVVLKRWERLVKQFLNQTVDIDHAMRVVSKTKRAKIVKELRWYNEHSSEITVPRLTSILDEVCSIADLAKVEAAVAEATATETKVS